MNNPPMKTRKRAWQDYFGALGRAHHTASAQLESSMPLLRHLDELRQRMFRAFLGVLLTTALSFVFTRQLIDFLAAPIGGSQALVSIEVTENIAIYMRVALLSGLVLGMPIMLYEILSFILPGLKGNERKWLLWGVPTASLLFLAGVAFCWFVMLPAAIPFLVNFIGITTHVRPANYFNFITTLLFWIGVSFEMPLVVALLAKLKLVTARQLLKAWRYAVVLIALLAAVITPTVDPLNMGLVMAPLCMLYLVSVLLARLVGKS
jgi:sec-independent protein translocase protein TatC